MPNDMFDVLVRAVVAGLIASVACGLGVLPLFIPGLDPSKHRGLAYGAAGGLMCSASVYNLILPALGSDKAGWTFQQVLPIIVGFLIGAAFLAIVEHRMHRANGSSLGGNTEPANGWGGRVGLLVFLTMTFHSIPEGLAVGMPMRAAGASLTRCFVAAFLTSLPQPIAAIPAVLPAWIFQPLMPLLMGFAAGAMIFLVILELIPDALDTESRPRIAWAFTFGFCIMLLVQVIL